MLTVKQAAQRAGVSIALVYQWVESRLISHFRLGGKGKRGVIRIDEKDLDSFLVSCRVEPVRSTSRRPSQAYVPKHFKIN